MFTVNQIAAALETSSVNEAVLNHVHNFQIKHSKTGELPVKKQITTHDDRKYNLAVTAFLILIAA